MRFWDSEETHTPGQPAGEGKKGSFGKIVAIVLVAGVVFRRPLLALRDAVLRRLRGDS